MKRRPSGQIRQSRPSKRPRRSKETGRAIEVPREEDVPEVRNSEVRVTEEVRDLPEPEPETQQAQQEAQTANAEPQPQEFTKHADKRVDQAIRKYDSHGFVERDLWDTIFQLAYQQSQDLTMSLVQWGCIGGIRDSRVSSRRSTGKIFDPTSQSFTLWPLPSEVCPTPEWKLDDELAALVTAAKRKIHFDRNGDNNSQEESESDDNSTKLLADENRKILFDLFNNMYEYHPPHSSSTPIFTRSKRLIRLKNPQDASNQSGQLVYGNEVDFGLDWKFVLKVAGETLDIKQSVLQKTKERLCMMYKIPRENSHFDQEYSQERRMEQIDPRLCPLTEVE